MAGETTIAAGVDLSVNVQNALKGIQAVDKATSSMINSFQKVSDQVDAVIQRIENLTAVAAKANQTVNHINNSTNNSTNYNHTVNTGGIPTVSTKSGTFAMPSGGRNPKFRQAEDEFLNLQKEEIETQKKITLLTKAKADTLNEELKYIKQTKDTAAKNAQARVDTAAFKNSKENKAYFQALADKHTDLSDFYKYKSAHPDMFAAGALLRSPRYQFGKAFEGVGTKVGTFGVGSDKLEGKAIGGVISAIGTLMKSPVAGGAAALMGFANGILEVGKAATQAYAEIESIRTQLGVVFSSQTQADSMFGELAQYATKSPFGVQQTSELAILLKQSGVYASDLMDTLKMIGDTAGGNMEKMKRIANNYAQIVSIGKASMLDMRQFAYAGIPIFEAVSKELGVSQQELRKLISDGKVTSDIIEKVFKDLTGINGIFENATEKGAKTLKARLQNLADAKQLAMGEVGEWITSYGTRGNDSYANQIVTGLENIYSYFQEKVSTVNIEKSVRNIEDRNSDIQALETLLEISKKNGDMASQAAIEKMIATLIAKGSVDEERNIYAKSYDKKYIDYETNKRTVDSFGHNMLIYGSYENLYNAAMGEKLRRDAGGGYNSEFAIYSDELLKAFIQALENLLNAEERNKTITNEERLANIERNTLVAQSLAYDNANKSADATTSLNSYFDELASIFENSKEQQQKKEEEKIKLLKAAQEELKVLATHADEKGNVDILSFSRKEFNDYVQRGAFKAVGKLTSVKGDGKSERQMAEDRPQLFANYKKVVSEIDSEIPRIRFDDTKVYKAIENLDKIKDNRKFYEEFNKFNDGFLGQLKKLQKEGIITESQQESFAKSIAQYMNKYELRVGGQFADVEAQKGKELPEYVELWKRIAANATGWDAAQIRGSGAQFISDYSKQASRNIVTGGVQGLVSAGTMSGDILSRMRYEDSVNKQGVRQIDWRKTEHDMIKDALSLRDGVKMSASALSGLSKALGDQLSVYEKLTVDMVGVGEDWSTINTSLKDGFKNNPHLNAGNFLDSAFQASAKSVGGYSLAYDNELGLVVKNASGTIEGSVDELKDQLKKNQNAFGGDLKTFVQSIGRDTIIKALDDLRKSTMALNDTIGLATSVTKQAADWDKQASQTWGKALGGTSGGITSLLRGSGINPGSMSKESKSYLGGFTSSFAGSLLSIDTKNWNNKAIKEYAKEHGGGEDFTDKQLESIREAVKEFQKSPESFEKLQKVFEAMGKPVAELADSAERLAKADKAAKTLQAADDVLNNTNLSFLDFLDTDKNVKNLSANPVQMAVEDIFRQSRKNSNTFQQQLLLSERGYGNESFNEHSKRMTGLAFYNKDRGLLKGYEKAGNNFIAGELGDKKDSWRSQLTQNQFSEAIRIGDMEKARSIIQELGGDFDKLTESVNQSAMAGGSAGAVFADLGNNIGSALRSFTTSAVSSSMSTWGKAVAESADKSEALAENFRQLGAGLLSNLGTMITEAGLSMAIHAPDYAGVLSGLALAAAGGGMSFLSGYLSGDKSKDKDNTDKELEKLLKIKENLADLLKQAREDAIYYEKTVRHQNALSTNGQIGNVTKVNDAIITPSGNVISTHPDDYLIATKTPQTIMGGNNAPSVVFNVIDKSTGIRVAQQKSTYNKETNTIDYTAIIEDKVKEIIAGPSGDEAFDAREFRIRGKQYVG